MKSNLPNRGIAHIVPASRKRFRVKYIAKNGEVLAISEVINTRKNALKNISSVAKLSGTLSVIYIVDRTKKEPIELCVDSFNNVWNFTEK